MSVQKSKTALEEALLSRPTPPRGLAGMGGGSSLRSGQPAPPAPAVNKTAALVGLALGGAPGALAGVTGFSQGQAAAQAKLDAQARAQEKAAMDQWKTDRQGWLDEVQGLRMAHLFEEDTLDREDKAGEKLDKAAKDAAASSRQEQLDNARQVTEKRLSRAGVVRDLLQLAPEAQGAYLDLLGEEGLNDIGLKVPRITRAQAEDGSPSLEEWDISAFQKAKASNLSPEALAARQEVEKVQASHKAGLQTMNLFSKIIEDPRTGGNARKELTKRLGIISNSLDEGKPIPPWVFEVSNQVMEAMTPAQAKAAAQREKSQKEQERKNKATEADRDADRSQRENKPSASLTEAQTRYGALTDQVSSYRADARKLRAKEAEANKKLKAISAMPQYQGVGGGARAQKHPGFVEAQAQAQSFGMSAINLENLAKESEKERSKIESRYPALKASFKAGAQAGANYTPPSKKLPPVTLPPLKVGESKTMNGGFKVRRVK